MTLLLPTLAVAFAAFCVWLSVRIVNRRERWAKWTLALAVGLPVLYVLSFGPACWWFPRTALGEVGPPYKAVHAVYWPFGWMLKNGPAPISRASSWYARLGRGDIYLPTTISDNEHFNAGWLDLD